MRRGDFFLSFEHTHSPQIHDFIRGVIACFEGAHGWVPEDSLFINPNYVLLDAEFGVTGFELRLRHKVSLVLRALTLFFQESRK